MNQTLKITLLKRKFQSLEYIEEFITNYQQFIQTGLDAFDAYKAYRQQHPEFKPNDVMAFEESFWQNRVLPNFHGMLQRSTEALDNARKGKVTTVRSLAGSFRGLSRGVDGVGETFMEVVQTGLEEKFLKQCKQTNRPIILKKYQQLVERLIHSGRGNHWPH
ncbi:hypothetical protein [Amphritea pacifica]|uniref:hypothetical protein n=1 Tax=Amphritea pacifica TaxID=2811233 RepID=UPI0019631C21|nr:hypothetical protein [Amphritea pacifica]MBN1006543.1 hypothetical protein [Amphritea pacifica]